jgi:hypothetical protein
MHPFVTIHIMLLSEDSSFDDKSMKKKKGKKVKQFGKKQVKTTTDGA